MKLRSVIISMLQIENNFVFLNFLKRKEGEIMGKRLNLLYFRKRQNLNQKAMAEKLGITTTHYSRIETGISNPSFDIMERLSNVFNVKSEEVFKLFEKCQ